MGFRRVARLAAFAAALVATRAVADVDVEVPLALSARGTLLPAGDVETYRFFATAGTSLTFSATSGRGATLAFAARLFDPADVEVVIPPERLKLTAKKLTVTKLPLTSTGRYRLQISATGTGEYSMSLSGRAQSKFSTTTAVSAAGTTAFPFSAPPGSRVSLSATAARGSQATPRFGVLSGDGLNVDLSTLTAPKTSSHVVVLQKIGGTGDVSVEVNNPGAAGDVTVTASVRPPRVKTLKLDARGAARGRPFGGESVVVRSVGASGGSVEVADPESDVAGAKVTFPPGALAADSTVTIASAAAPKPAAVDQLAGPAVFFGPPGVTFASPVDVEVPFDPARIPVGQTSQDLRVLVAEANGATAILTPKAFDDLGRTVTVEANGFSTFVTIARAGLQPLGVRPGGDEFWFLSFKGDIALAASMDSRARKFAIGLGEATFSSGGVFELLSTDRSFSYENATSADGDHLDGNLVNAAGPQNLSSTWAYGTDGQTVLVDAGDGGTHALVASRDGNYLVARGNEPTDPHAEVDLFVRKNASPLSAASLAGKYHLARFAVDANDDGADFGVRPRSSRSTGTWTFTAAGKFTVAGSSRESDMTGGGAPTSDFATFSDAGTFVVEPAGTVLATFTPSQGDPATVFRFFPGPAGAVLIGTHRDPSESNLEALVLVRQGAGLGNNTATGEYRGVSFDTEMFPYTVQGTTGPPFVEFTVADYQVSDEAVVLQFSPTGSMTYEAQKHSARRSEGAAEGVSVSDQTRPTLVFTSKIDSIGRIALSRPGESARLGVVSSDGTFGCGVSDPATNDEYNSLLFFVKPPPPDL
jgi:hypothetical protein